MPAFIGQRFKTGDKCITTGAYQFDGYTDGTRDPAPTTDERFIPMVDGFTFPPVRSSSKAAWWKYVT